MKNKEIYLREEEQECLRAIVRNGVHNSHEITRARVLLLLDRSGKTDHVRYKRTAESTGVSVQAVYNMRDEFFLDYACLFSKRNTASMSRYAKQGFKSYILQR